MSPPFSFEQMHIMVCNFVSSQSIWKALEGTSTIVYFHDMLCLTTKEIFSGICLSLSRSHEVVLCLLDLSSAFHTLQHDILIQRLADIGVRDKALEWFRYNLVDQTTSVKVNNSRF